MQISNQSNKPQIFNHQSFGNLPVIVIDGAEWFGATEAAKALGFSNPHKAVDHHVENEDCTVHTVPTDGGIQNKKFINESGVYSLIFGAARQGNNPEIQEKARQFKRWVTSEVLPTIRKTGSYAMIPRTLPEALRLAADLAEKNEALRLENAQKEIIISELQPKARYVDQILKSKATVTITQIAKDYGLTGTELNKILHEEGVQYKVNKQWVLYKKHADSGYTKSETIDIVRSNGEPDVTMVTKWTQKGRLFIHEILAKRNIVPYMDRKVTA